VAGLAPTAAVPELATWAMMLLGFAGLALCVPPQVVVRLNNKQIFHTRVRLENYDSNVDGGFSDTLYPK
jgi:hypothetical protein